MHVYLSPFAKSAIFSCKIIANFAQSDLTCKMEVVQLWKLAEKVRNNFKRCKNAIFVKRKKAISFKKIEAECANSGALSLVNEQFRKYLFKLKAALLILNEEQDLRWNWMQKIADFANAESYACSSFLLWKYQV